MKKSNMCSTNYEKVPKGKYLNLRFGTEKIRAMKISGPEQSPLIPMNEHLGLMWHGSRLTCINEPISLDHSLALLYPLKTSMCLKLGLLH